MHISDWSSDVCSSDLSNGNVRFGALGCDAHLFRTAPGDRADIAVREPIGLHHLVTGGIDLGNRIRNFESEDSSAVVQPLAMPCQCKDLSAIGTLPLEHAGCIVYCVSKNMDVCFPPRDQLAIKPDPSITVIIGAFIKGHDTRSEEQTHELQ